MADDGTLPRVERRGRDRGRRRVLRHARWLVQGGRREDRQGPVAVQSRIGRVGNPITYTGREGKQYVAVYAGIGGDWFLLSGDVRSDDPADVRAPADFMPDIARHTSQGGIVWIFAL